MDGEYFVYKIDWIIKMSMARLRGLWDIADHVFIEKISLVITKKLDTYLSMNVSKNMMSPMRNNQTYIQ